MIIVVVTPLASAFIGNAPITPGVVGTGIEVVQDGEYLTNRHEAILGGDDKAAVAAMLYAVDRVVHEGIPHAGIELVFTPCEEVGLRGAVAIASRLAAKHG